MKTIQTALRRRFALLATSSLGALSVIACTGALLPSTALAADECGVQTTDGAQIICPAGTYPSGISYSGGNIPLILQDAVVVTDGGLSIDASTAILIRAQNLVTGGAPQIANSGGPGISLTSGDSINLQFTRFTVDGTNGFVTGTSGVVVASAGRANIASYVAIPITATDPAGVGLSVDTGAGFSNVSWNGAITSAGTGVRAHVTTGFLFVSTGDITAGGTAVQAQATNGSIGVGTGAINATGDAVIASASGSGSVTVFAGPINAGGRGIVVTTESGDAVVGVGGDITVGVGPKISIQSGGSASLNVGATVRRDDYDISAVNNIGFDVGGVLTSTTGSASDLAIQESAATATITVFGGLLNGSVDLSGMTDGTSTDIAYGGRWHFGGQSLLSSSTDTLLLENPFVDADPGIIIADDGAVLDFGAGNDSFTNQGRIVFDGTFTLSHLETFDNFRVIAFGGADGQTTDGVPNDRLVANGATFTGSAYQPAGATEDWQSTLLLDVNFAGAQDNCSAAVVADCLSLVGGSTTGQTLVHVNRVGAGLPTLGTRIVLVDVAGGTSAAENFVLDPTSAGYTNNEILGPGFDTGLLFVKFTYDPAAQQHILISAPNRLAYQMAILPTAAQTLWHTSVGAWEDRTAGLIDSLAAGGSGGPATWIKYVRSRHDRDMKSDFIGANPGFYTSYRQDTDTVIGGVDLLRGGGEGEAYVLGLTVGHVNSDVTFDESLTTSNFKGMTYGAYGSYLADLFFVDGVVQLNRLDYDDAQSGERAEGSLTSTGAQVEAGFRIPISDGAAHIEPLASLAYVRTKFDELAYSNATFAPEDTTSLRGSIGARIAGGVSFRPLTIRGSLTARVWDEFKGDNNARLVGGGASAPLEDDFSGAFGDVGVGLSVATPDDRLAGFLSTNVKFKENFFSSDASVGLRYRW